MDDYVPYDKESGCMAMCMAALALAMAVGFTLEHFGVWTP